MRRHITRFVGKHGRVFDPPRPLRNRKKASERRKCNSTKMGDIDSFSEFLVCDLQTIENCPRKIALKPKVLTIKIDGN